MKDLKGINAEPDVKDVEDIKCYVGRQARLQCGLANWSLGKKMEYLFRR